MENKLEIEYIPLAELIPYAKNPRKNDKAVEVVMRSIKEFGFKVPIILDKKGEIIAGHTRLKAAAKLKLKEVPVIRAEELSPEQVKAFRIMDNKSHEYSSWDDDLLKEELVVLQNADFKLDLTGFSFRELGNILEKDIIEDTVSINAYERAKAKTKIKQGEIFKLGNHRLMCGDSTKKEDVDALMAKHKADMVFTDPPYGMCLNTDWSGAKSRLSFLEHTGAKPQGNRYKKVIGDNDDFDPKFITHTLDYFNYCKEILLWGADYYAEIIPNRKEGSFFVWDKRSNEGTDIEKVKQSDKMYGSCFELCWSKNKHKREIVRVKWAGIFGTETEPDKDKSRIHPTQKPINLNRWFLDKFSKKENIIVDLFGGSGSTLIACEQLNRKCFMMEIDPVYCQVIINRWEKLTGKQAKNT